MWVARSEWKSPESNEYIGWATEENRDKLIDKVIEWVEQAERELYVSFSSFSNRGEMYEAIDDKGEIYSDGAYREETEDWVCYMIDWVDEVK